MPPKVILTGTSLAGAVRVSAGLAGLLVLGSACSTAPVPSRFSDRPLVLPPGASQLLVGGGVLIGRWLPTGRTPGPRSNDLIRPAPSFAFRGGIIDGVDLQLPLMFGIELSKSHELELALQLGIAEFGFGISSSVDYGFIRPGAGLALRLRLDEQTSLLLGTFAGVRVIFASRPEDHGPFFLHAIPAVAYDVSDDLSLTLATGLTGVVTPAGSHELWFNIGGGSGFTGSPTPTVALHLSPSWDLIAIVGATVPLVPEQEVSVHAIAGFEWHSSVE